MRLILDTNILLSALLSPMGAPAKLLDAWERKRFMLVACDALVAELRDVAGQAVLPGETPSQLGRAGRRWDSRLLFLLPGPAAPVRSLRIPRTATCSPWLKPAKPSFW